MDFQEMCVGFVYCKEFKTGDHVLLIRKAHPEWQYGLLNGVGGHRENTDRGWFEAMQREGREEIGLDLEWEHFASIGGENYELKVFRVFVDFETAWKLEAQTDEEIHWVPLREVHSGATGFASEDLQFLIPLGSYQAKNFRDVRFQEV